MEKWHSASESDPVISVTLNGTGGTKAWVVVDSLVDSIAMGGTRMTESVTEGEVCDLAKGMTTKLSLVGLPIGGAKAGILSAAELRDESLRDFGRAVAPLLHGGIHLGCDLGVTQADRALFYAEASYDVRRRPRSSALPIDWGTYWEPLVDVTGFGVGIAATTALQAWPGPESRRVVVQGFGTVGRAVAKFLEQCGHRIVGVADVLGTMHDAAGLPVAELISITDSTGRVDRSQLPDSVSVSTDPDSWLDVAADILVLAANKAAINPENVYRLSAGLIVEGGNLCCSPYAKEVMASKGIIVVPDVVANVGAAAAGGLALTGTVPFDLSLSQMAAWVFDWVETRVHRNTRDLLEIIAADDGDPVPELLAARHERSS